MKTIYIDADACPVKEEAYRVAARYRWSTFVVANQPITTPASQIIFCIQVGDGLDEADDWIAKRAGPGDIVITADIPLAARVLERGARALGPRGHEFTVDSIGDALASRALSQELREIGVETGGPSPMVQKDRSQFLQKLDQLINAAQRETANA